MTTTIAWFVAMNASVCSVFLCLQHHCQCILLCLIYCMVAVVDCVASGFKVAWKNWSRIPCCCKDHHPCDGSSLSDKASKWWVGLVNAHPSPELFTQTWRRGERTLTLLWLIVVISVVIVVLELLLSLSLSLLLLLLLLFCCRRCHSNWLLGKYFASVCCTVLKQ